MDWCSAYQGKEACRKRFDCQLFSNFFKLVNAGEFKDKQDKDIWPSAPFKITKTEIECKKFKAK